MKYTCIKNPAKFAKFGVVLESNMFVGFGLVPFLDVAISPVPLPCDAVNLQPRMPQTQWPGWPCCGEGGLHCICTAPHVRTRPATQPRSTPHTGRICAPTSSVLNGFSAHATVQRVLLVSPPPHNKLSAEICNYVLRTQIAESLKQHNRSSLHCWDQTMRHRIKTPMLPWSLNAPYNTVYFMKLSTECNVCFIFNSSMHIPFTYWSNYTSLPFNLDSWHRHAQTVHNIDRYRVLE